LPGVVKELLRAHLVEVKQHERDLIEGLGRVALAVRTGDQVILITSTAVMLAISLLGRSSGSALAVAMNPPDDVRTFLKDASGFQVRASVSAIPIAVRASFAQARNGEPFAMAEPGAERQVTDVIRKPGLARRRIRKVALSESFCILFYELGGRAHSYHAAVFRLSRDGAVLVWRAVLDQTVSDPAALLKAIDEEKVDDHSRNVF
jgi:hypothetical protein